MLLDGYTLYPADDVHWSIFDQVADIDIYDRTAPCDIISRCRDAEAILTNKVILDAATIAALPRLRYIGVLATGYNVVDIDAARENGITVTNIPAYSTMSVAQHVFALILAITNRVETYADANRDKAWSRSADFTYRLGEWPELAGKTLGIVGFGNIGAAVARIAAAIGMKISVFTSRPQSDLPAGYAKTNLNSLLRESDIISLHCPLTTATKNLIDAEALNKMKPTAILINTSRGPVVDENALADALTARRIAAAGLDVMSNEPPRPDNPLLACPNCYITPHVAWASTEARERLLDLAARNLHAFNSGAPVNVVNA